MNATETLDTYLVEQFRAFYAELVVLKQAIARGDRTVAAGGESADTIKTGTNIAFTKI